MLLSMVFVLMVSGVFEIARVLSSPSWQEIGNRRPQVFQKLLRALLESFDVPVAADISLD